MTRFFIGSSPSMASTIISSDAPAAGVMVSMTALARRKSDFQVGEWILDSGAFTQVTKYGRFLQSPNSYARQINRWARCGNLLAAVTQDYMCEPFALERTGLTIAQHQELTIKNYDALTPLTETLIMPVLQGYSVSDYLHHLHQYGRRLQPGAWVGVGSVCRRNGSPAEVLDILRAIKLLRPDLRLHGFGLKLTALQHPEIQELLYSADSMAWSIPNKYAPPAERTDELELAHAYQEKIGQALNGELTRKVPKTAGAGNGQGRKPGWKNSPTVPIRVPQILAKPLLEIAREWDEEASQ